MGEFKKCPLCSCLFLTDYDLNLHEVSFGSDAEKHLRKKRRVRLDIENTIEREHGCADRIVREIAQIVLDSAKKKRKGGSSG